MAHKSNYTKYSNYSKAQETPVVESEVKAEEPVVEETPVIEEPVAAPVVESEVKAEEPVIEEDDYEIIGVVVDCAKLNVREEPEADAEILTTIPKGAEVKVDFFNSTDDFYKVCTGAGVEGYCVKDYISID